MLQFRPLAILLVLATAITLFSGAAGAHVRLDSPVGGEKFAQNETIEIQWNAYLYHGPGTIELDFSADGGISYTSIATNIPISSAAQMVGVYTWSLPAIDSAMCQIRATYQSESQGSYVGTTPVFIVGNPTDGGGTDPGDITDGQNVVIEAFKDNTLYQDAAGGLSNGAGEYMFAGKTKTSDIRRGLITFDIGTVLPVDVTVTSVSLQLNVSKLASANPQQVVLIPMTADWGEGLSDAPAEEGKGTVALEGDATWIHRHAPSTLWAIPGGDFTTGISAQVSITATGANIFESTPEMIADVQLWLDDPSSNFGWLIAGNESSSTTAVRFNTRENNILESRPQLTVTYSTADPTSRGSIDVDDDGEVRPLTDGSLILRYLFGFTAETLIDGAVSATCERCDAAVLDDYLTESKPLYDIDDDKMIRPLTDGLLLLRHMFGFTGDALVDGVTTMECGRCTTPEIEPYLQQLYPGV